MVLLRHTNPRGSQCCVGSCIVWFEIWKRKIVCSCTHTMTRTPLFTDFGNLMLAYVVVRKKRVFVLYSVVVYDLAETFLFYKKYDIGSPGFWVKIKNIVLYPVGEKCATSQELRSFCLSRTLLSLVSWIVTARNVQTGTVVRVRKKVLKGFEHCVYDLDQNLSVSSTDSKVISLLSTLTWCDFRVSWFY